MASARVQSCTLCFQPYDELNHKKVVLHFIAKEVHALCMPCLEDLAKTNKSSEKTCPFCSADFRKVGVSEVAKRVLGIDDAAAKRPTKAEGPKDHSPMKKGRVESTVRLMDVPEEGLPPILKEDFLEIQASLDILIDSSSEAESVKKAWKQLGMLVPENCRSDNNLITQSLLLRLRGECTSKQCSDLDGIILAFEALRERKPLGSIPKQEPSPLTKGSRV